MTDHADTIRDYFDRAFEKDDAENRAAFDALSALLAERQQAIDDGERGWRRAEWLENKLETAQAERQQAIDERDAAEQNLSVIAAFLNCREGLEVEAVKQMQARCEQAIDALREQDHLRAEQEQEIMRLRQQMRAATRKVCGAKDDLTRSDPHPNDRHKALAKLSEAETLLAALLSLGEQPE